MAGEEGSDCGAAEVGESNKARETLEVVAADEVEPAVVGEAMGDDSGERGHAAAAAMIAGVGSNDQDSGNDEACNAAMDDAAASREGTSRCVGVFSCLAAPESAAGKSRRRVGIRGNGGGDGTDDDGGGMYDDKNGDSVENGGRNESEDAPPVALKAGPSDSRGRPFVNQSTPRSCASVSGCNVECNDELWP